VFVQIIIHGAMFPMYRLYLGISTHINRLLVFTVNTQYSFKQCHYQFSY